MISIIIPVYNTAKYLPRCLQSITSQTYIDWEAILVNDGSLDESGRICDEYAAKDCRFKVLHQKNRGVVVARDNALTIAKGDFLIFIDSDDYIEPTMLAEMKILAQKENLDIVWCNFKTIHKEHSKEEYIKLDCDNENNIKRVLTSHIPGFLWNKLIKKEFWDKCDIQTDKDAVMCEDTYISVQLLANNPQMGIVSKPLYNYIKYNENAVTATNDLPILVKAEKNIINIYHFLKEKNLLDKNIKEFTRLALRLKIEMLPYNMKKAINLFPFAHKKLNNFHFPHIISFYYWLGFNTGFLGKLLFKLKFR